MQEEGNAGVGHPDTSVTKPKGKVAVLDGLKVGPKP